MIHSSFIDYFLMAVSAGARAAVAGFIVYGLTRFHEGLGLPERVGAGLIGGSALMTIPIVFDVDKNGTPFDVWAGTVSAVGILVFIVGRLIRLRKHANNNQAQIDAALVHFDRKRRGK